MFSTWLPWIKTLTKDISCECKCKLDGRKCNSNQWWNNDKCWFECKIIHVCEVIKSYEEEIKNSPTNFNEKKVTYKTHILLAFLLITIALLITVSSYCYMIKYQTKQLLPFHGIKN